ncbi:MAG: Si-specific NAD(P)(+) transhydrogenase [Gammaproteobacteria bacterium]|nr:Si-specific NAD(P)(+) transhydrogenase [Gammaproteobacteria bacterium]
MQHFDFIVIGSGPAGQRAAVQAKKIGKNVAVIEQRTAVGGVSVHTGTIPSKTLREAALYLSGWNQRGLYGHSYRLKKQVTLEDLINRLNITLTHEVEVIRAQLARNNAVVIHGTATFVDANTIKVESETGEINQYTADKFLIATGTRPIRPENITFDNETIIDSDGVMNLKKLPHTMAIIGAGVIGVEYASIFSILDIKVTLVDGRPNILSFLDYELVEELTHLMRENKIILRLGEKVAEVNHNSSGHVITVLESGKRLCTDLVLVAAGRIGCTYGIKPENAGVKTDEQRRIKVNEHFQTEVPHIYAAGDVIGFPSLASTSMEQGRRAACHAFGASSTIQQQFFPFGIYAVPEISTIGMNEQELTEKKIPYETGVARIRETARGQIMGLENGILKLLIGLDDRKILGVHIIGEGATELIHIGQAVLVLDGKLDYFLENVFNYPTLAEAYKIAALDAWNRISCLNGNESEESPGCAI